jgi:hypothetical protein
MSERVGNIYVAFLQGTIVTSEDKEQAEIISRNAQKFGPFSQVGVTVDRVVGIIRFSDRPGIETQTVANLKDGFCSTETVLALC